MRPRRRRSPRVAVRSLTYVKLEQDNGGIILDLTESGVAIHAVKSLREGHEVQLRFEVNSPRVRVEARGRVAWADWGGKAGHSVCRCCSAGAAGTAGLAASADAFGGGGFGAGLDVFVAGDGAEVLGAGESSDCGGSAGAASGVGMVFGFGARVCKVCGRIDSGLRCGGFCDWSDCGNGRDSAVALGGRVDGFGSGDFYGGLSGDVFLVGRGHGGESVG